MGQAALVQILSKPCISAMHLFTSFFVTNFVRKTDDKILDWSKLKQMADGNFKVHFKWKISAI